MISASWDAVAEVSEGARECGGGREDEGLLISNFIRAEVNIHLIG